MISCKWYLYISDFWDLKILSAILNNYGVSLFDYVFLYLSAVYDLFFSAF